MTPLPFAWPYALVFWLVYLWVYWPEFAIVQRARRTRTEKDAKSLQVILFVGGLGFLAAFPLAFVPALQFPGNRIVVFFIGVAVLVLGSLLRRHCFRMLGSSFTGDVRAHAGQQIITRGAYSVLRHPSYTAGILVSLGMGIALGSWASAALMTLAAFAGYAYRMTVEERALVAAIGEPYQRFMRTRKRLIPFIY